MSRRTLIPRAIAGRMLQAHSGDHYPETVMPVLRPICATLTVLALLVGTVCPVAAGSAMKGNNASTNLRQVGADEPNDAIEEIEDPAAREQAKLLFKALRKGDKQEAERIYAEGRKKFGWVPQREQPREPPVITGTPAQAPPNKLGRTNMMPAEWSK